MGVFLSGGVLASQIDCYLATAYARGQLPRLFRWIKSGPGPDPTGPLYGYSMGASSGLCSMLTLATISAPWRRSRFPLIPVDFPLVWFTTGLVCWKFWSYCKKTKDGIGHGGHLGGCGSGALLGWFGLDILSWVHSGKDLGNSPGGTLSL